ncbi:MAG: purine-nucleoside phosphorylase [Candidatus Eisenbacteria bacterium]|uniref:Purine nucleoside phosphorylase n=1 Tax=Eiseniibacteriota bacterium TaxID=2212470 RepID=A0A7Y2EA72_UNCEI|nr:purine-nucleoside phosphorylase [Candidatus Eisenbacteria bacterium]
MSEKKLPERIAEARSYIESKTKVKPRVGLILGTGLGDVSDAVKDAIKIPYSEVPGFASSTAESHAGELLLGHMKDTPVVMMNGRVHFYEGYSMEQVTFPIRVMRALGVTHLVVSNAVGGMNPLFKPGDIMAVTDHINLMGDNPLIGPNYDELGPRFPDMSEPYDTELLELAEQVALEEKIPLKQGVFVAVAGPNLETRAEYRMLRAMGADVVGMSLIPENIVAVHGGMKVLALSVITDACFPDALEPVDIKKILAVAAGAEPSVKKLLTRILERL